MMEQGFFLILPFKVLIFRSESFLKIGDGLTKNKVERRNMELRH